MKIKIRDARPADKEPLMSFIRNVWGGQDYIPGVWDAWIADKSAVMNVLEVDGKQVGLNRMRFLDDGTAWLEGVRIHPDYRGRGLASMLGMRSIQIGGRRGIRRYRLVSGSRNKAAHSQVGKMGFKELGRMSVYIAEPGRRFRAQNRVRVASGRDVPGVLKAIRASREFRLGAGVYWDGFAATSITEETLGGLADGGNVFVTEGAVAIGKVGGEGNDRWKQICFLEGENEGTAILAEHVLGVKEPFRTSMKIAYVPKGSKMGSVLKGIGLKRRWPLTLFGIDVPPGKAGTSARNGR